MTKSEFLAAATRWTKGSMGCGPGWNGWITYKHTVVTTKEEALAGGVNDKGGTHTLTSTSRT